MFRLARMALVGVALGAVGLPAGRGQTPAPGPAAAPAPGPQAPTAAGEPEILRALPRVAETPGSLLAPAPPPGPPPPDAERPYFQPDPLLDTPPLPPPGWFFVVDLDVTKGHVKNQLSTAVANPATGKSDQVGLPSAPLDWAINPRFEAGYRLPSGFGEILLAYRFLATQGSETVEGTDGPARLSSLLDINQVDFDYSNRELSLWPKWNMRWRAGLRYADVYFDSRAEEAFALAAAGSGVFQTRTTDSFVGIGPHGAVELSRCFGPSGLAFVTKADFALLVGRIRQQFIERTTTLGPDGQPLAGALSVSDSVGVPVLNVQAGLGWRPPRYPRAAFFLGYQYEYWWEVGLLSNINNLGGTFGEVADQGFVLRAEFNF
jgi:hypothetical protein